MPARPRNCARSCSARRTSALLLMRRPWHGMALHGMQVLKNSGKTRGRCGFTNKRLVYCADIDSVKVDCSAPDFEGSGIRHDASEGLFVCLGNEWVAPGQLWPVLLVGRCARDDCAESRRGDSWTGASRQAARTVVLIRRSAFDECSLACFLVVLVVGAIASTTSSSTPRTSRTCIQQLR